MRRPPLLFLPGSHSKIGRGLTDCIAALTLFVVLFIPLLSARSQTSLKVISFNIHGMAPGSDPSTRLVHIIQGLEQLDPDIVGVQEINETLGGNGEDNQGKIIADSLAHYFGRAYYYYSSATHTAWDNTCLEFVGIISKYPLLKSGFSNLAVSDFPRKVVWCSVETPVGLVLFFNTHLSGDIAAQQVQQIMQYIQTQEQTNPGVASILTGDFNSTPESEAIQLLLGDGSDTTFADTYGEANPSSTGFTAPAGDATSRIDYVFYHLSGALDVTGSDVVFTAPFAADRYCSDHYGVMTTFVEKLIPTISAPASCVFPSLMPGMEFRKDLSVSNTGIEPLEIESVTNSSTAFQIVGLPQLPVSLTRGGPALSVGIVYTPAGSGSYVDTVIIASSDPVNPHIRIALRGKCVATLATAQPGVLYATSTGPSDGFLHTIDPTTGNTTTIGPTGVRGIHTLVVQPSTHELYGVVTGGDSTWLYRIGTQSGDAVPVFVVKAGSLRAMAFGGQDALYGTTTTGGFCRIDIADGTVSSLGAPLKYRFAGICMSPGGALWGCLENETDSTYRIDPLTGAVHYVGVTGFLAYTRSLAFSADGSLYALIDNGYNVNYIATLDTVTALGMTAYATGTNNLTAIAMSPELPTSVRETNRPAAPAAWALWQNYPNPFNPKTRIMYELAKATHVRLTLYDVVGREVMTLFEGTQLAGNQSVEFDAGSLSSGVYFYRLQAGQFAAVKKLVVVR